MEVTLDTVNVEELRRRFTEHQCHGVVELIDFLSSSKGSKIICIGSSTIGVSEILNEIWLSKADQLKSAWFRARNLHIGSSDGSITPLQWLEKLSEVLGSVSIQARTRFDKLCSGFAQIASKAPSGPVEIFNARGHFLVPKDKSHLDDEMTDEELELYRVNKDVPTAH